MLAAALPFNALASNVEQQSFEQQVAEADLVVVAKTSELKRDVLQRTDRTGLMQLSKMKVLRVLKGDQTLTNFDLVTRGEVAELDPKCCKKGVVYILLLQRGSDQDIYSAVNGRYSVVPVR